MTQFKVKPPVKREDIESSFDVSYNGDKLVIEAGHTWEVSRDPLDWSNLTREQWENVEPTEMYIEIVREFNYRERDDLYSYVSCDVSKHCDVPDVNGYNDRSKYPLDFPDPWLFEDDQEEFRVVAGIPVNRELKTIKDGDGGYTTNRHYDQIYSSPLGQEDIETFAYAHHFGKLDGSPNPVNQIIDVLNWNNPGAITLEEFEEMHHNVTEGATAD